MTSTTTHKLGLTVEDGNELADQVASLNVNYDILDAKSSSNRRLLITSSEWVGPPGNQYELDHPDAGLVGAAEMSINTGGLWQRAPNNVAAPFLTKVAVGDWIQITLNGLWNNSPSTGEFCVATSFNSGPGPVPINSFGSACALGTVGGNGISSCRGEANQFSKLSAKVLKQVVVGDLVDGVGVVNPAGTNVFFVALMKTVGYKFIFTIPGAPFIASAVNLGQ